MMEMFERQDATPNLKSKTSKCPLYPKSGVAFFQGHSAPPPRTVAFALAASAPSGKAQTEILYRVSHNRARQKRGPPSLSSI